MTIKAGGCFSALTGVEGGEQSNPRINGKVHADLSHDTRLCAAQPLQTDHTAATAYRNVPTAAFLCSQ